MRHKVRFRHRRYPGFGRLASRLGESGPSWAGPLPFPDAALSALKDGVDLDGLFTVIDVPEPSTSLLHPAGAAFLAVLA